MTACMWAVSDRVLLSCIFTSKLGCGLGFLSGVPGGSLNTRFYPFLILMYEPKYKLNQKDAKRFRALALKEATGEITLDERVELERLARKDYRKRESHPVARKIRRRRYYLHSKLMKAAKAVDAAVAKCCPEMRKALKGKSFVSALKRK